MPWHDDSWRETYDAWKLREPYYEDDERPDDCTHEDYEVDWGTMRAECSCGHSWYMTAEEIRSAVDQQRNYDKWCRRQLRWHVRLGEWWRGTRLVSWWRARSLKRRHPVTEVDDHMPF